MHDRGDDEPPGPLSVRDGRARRSRASSSRLAEDGELLIRSETIFAGYFKDPEATAAVLGDDGWLASGDIATIDEDGFVTITDRKKDIIVTAGGKNIAPQNLENDLKTIAVRLAGDGRRRPAALPGGADHARPGGDREVGDENRASRATSPRSPATPRVDGLVAGDRGRRQPRALALRAAQAVRDPRRATSRWSRAS